MAPKEAQRPESIRQMDRAGRQSGKRSACLRGHPKGYSAPVSRGGKLSGRRDRRGPESIRAGTHVFAPGLRGNAGDRHQRINADLPLDAWHRRPGGRMVPFALRHAGAVTRASWPNRGPAPTPVCLTSATLGNCCSAARGVDRALEKLLPGDLLALKDGGCAIDAARRKRRNYR